MKSILLAIFLSTSTLFAQKAPFASQSDMVVDLSDAVLDGIFHHRLGFPRCAFEKSVWLEGFGSYRERSSTCQRNHYDNWLGGLIGGFNYGISCNTYLNFFIGGSWGGIDICNEPPCFDTNSILFGMTWERIWAPYFFGLAIIGGVLNEERTFRGEFGSLKEEPNGVFLTPELNYAQQFNWKYLCPIFTAALRYAGFFSRDYQNRRTLGTLYVKDRSLQFFTLRGELAVPYRLNCFYLEPYLGLAGRFQFDGNRVEGRLNLDNKCFSDGIDSCMAYGLLGLRGARRFNCFNLQANAEWSYDSDCSWRILGELTLSYDY